MGFGRAVRAAACCWFVTGVLFATEAAGDASEPPQADVSVGLEYFRWEERDTSGARLLEEAGPRLRLGVNWDNLDRRTAGPLYALEGKLYLGQVDYDGQACNLLTSSCVTLRTDSRYIGFNAEGLGGYRTGGERGIDLLVSLGLDTWSRTIANGIASNGTEAAGTQEIYVIGYAKLGAGWHHAGEAWRTHLQLGAKYPFYTYEYAFLSDVGFNDDVVLTPGRDASAFARLRFQRRGSGQGRLAVSVYYDSLRLERSPAEPAVFRGVRFLVVQPESRMDVYGLELGYQF